MVRKRGVGYTQKMPLKGKMLIKNNIKDKVDDKPSKTKNYF